MTADQIEGIAALSAVPTIGLLMCLIERLRQLLYPTPGQHRPRYADFTEPPAEWQAVTWLDCTGPCQGLHVPHEVSGTLARCVGCGWKRVAPDPTGGGL